MNKEDITNALNELDDEVLEKTEQFRETFLSALDGHGSEKIYQYIKTRYIKRDQ